MQTNKRGGGTAPKRAKCARTIERSARADCVPVPCAAWALALLLCLIVSVGNPARAASDEEKKAGEAVAWVAKYTPTATTVNPKAYSVMVKNCWGFFGLLADGHREWSTLLKTSEHVEAVDLDKGIFKYYPKVIDVRRYGTSSMSSSTSPETRASGPSPSSWRTPGDAMFRPADRRCQDTAGRREKDVYLEVIFLGEVNGLEQGTVGIGACGVPVGESTIELDLRGREEGDREEHRHGCRRNLHRWGKERVAGGRGPSKGEDGSK